MTLLLLVACQRPLPPKEFDSRAAFEYLKHQVEFGPRVPGSPSHARMAQWLDSLLRARADTVIRQEWIHVTKQGDSLPMRNLLARFNPAAGERLLFLAHWDTRPVADADSGARAKQPIPGANDGASGVAILLGMADALKRTPPKVGVDLLFVDGEDYGLFSEEVDVLIGSRYFAEHLPPGPKPKFAVLLDMVGDRDLQIYQEGYSLTAAPDVVQLVWGIAARLGYANVLVPESRHTLTDDHIPLQKVGIPAIDLIDYDYGPNNAWWHTLEDSVDKVSERSLGVVGDVMMAVVREAK